MTGASTSTEWVDRLGAQQVSAVTDLVARATSADGVAPVSEQVLISLRAAGESVAAASDSEAAAPLHLLSVHEGGVVGYANLVVAHGDHPAMAEVVVDPAARGRGVGAALVSAALTAGGRGARVWAHGDLPAAKGLASKLGLAAARELWQMRRSLATPQLPDLIVPAGLRVRTYGGQADDAELLRVNNAAFDWHPEQGGWTESDLAARKAEPWFDPAGLFLVSEVDEPDRLLGFHWTKVHFDERPPVGEVYVVGVDPSAQGRGLGRLLTLAGLHHLHERELAEVLLYTEADNKAAVRTYAQLGFAPAHIDTAYAAQ